MKPIMNYVPVVLGLVIVAVAIVMTGGFMTPYEADDQDPWAQTSPTSLMDLVTDPTDSLYQNLAAVQSSRTIKSIATTPSTTTTTTAQLPIWELGPLGPISSIRIFLDRQRMVLYCKDPETGREYPARTFICSTGKSSTPTPTMSKGVPLGNKYLLSRFSSPKYVGTCLVRYVTHISSSYYIHAVPYLDPYPRGPVELRKDSCDLAAYRALGRPASSGCIRLCLRDAKFIYNNVQSGTTCYILASSSGYAIPNAVGVGYPSGSRGWDPTDPERPGYIGIPATTVTGPVSYVTTTTPETSAEDTSVTSPTEPSSTVPTDPTSPSTGDPTAETTTPTSTPATTTTTTTTSTTSSTAASTSSPTDPPPGP
ncbi:MAG: L,D-transpeptidase family protein [Saccharofermentanales bacterium]